MKIKNVNNISNFINFINFNFFCCNKKSYKEKWNDAFNKVANDNLHIRGSFSYRTGLRMDSAYGFWIKYDHQSIWGDVLFDHRAPSYSCAYNDPYTSLPLG